MKKLIALALLATTLTLNVSAQDERSNWSLNTRFRTTNYFSALLVDVANVVITDMLFEDSKDSLTMDRILPMADIVFPIGMQKSGFDDPLNIYGPYHRAFSNPFKYLGDYAIGIDASWQPSPIGFYAGAYFKSQEIVYKATDDNLRGFYFQPRAGIVLGSKQRSLEAGVFYDIVTGCRYNGKSADKKQLKEGLGLDFAFNFFDKGDHSSTTLQFSMPLHNMLNSDVQKRRVGYIMLSRRISF